MSEGPQVRLKTEWLQRRIGGRPARALQTGREDLASGCAAAEGRRIERVICKGKRIFIVFESGVALHNHLLMRGSWRSADGPFLFVPPGMWMAISVPGITVCNWNGQMLRWEDERGFREVWGALGPDVMDGTVAGDEIAAALAASGLPVAEALLDQSVISGLGNVARAEALFRAGVSPAHPARTLPAARLAAIAQAAQRVMRESYDAGGRWVHRVHQRAGTPCPACGATIRSVRLAPSRRALFYCPRCQRD